MLLRTLLPLSLLSLAMTGAMAQSPVSHQLQPNAVKSLLLDIGRAGDHMVAVGERGHVLLGNGSWQQVETPTRAQLTKVFFVNDNLGWAVGHDATIIHTRDGGKTWELQFSAPELERPFMDVLFINESEGFAIGAYGLFYQTRDGGKSWQDVFHEELLFDEDKTYLNELKETDPDAYAIEKASLLPHFNRLIKLEDGRLLMVGELGLVSVSDDGGASFNRLPFDYEGSMFSAMQNGDSVYVMGLRGHVFSSGLALDDWQQESLPVESSINGGLARNDGTLYFVGNAGVVLQKSGSDITLIARRQGENIVAAAQDNQGEVWLVGAKGVFALSSALGK
ncbi:WD40/YVTN/BNR-like repeat-containing protein [Shewanella khirikhana]|uniref:Ycf48-like protein n=1 Tax=Shewanella khirikhana TaxID=1965282 RepID=A0ABN5TVG5_9GAMM|nr:YCF48-related protein [Shewanella khirikhana]AZQ10377.1 Ycf48-like protein precursor [Shewanella khirikhana]